MKLTLREAIYLKLIYTLWERGVEVVSPKRIASKMRVSKPTAIEVLKKLSSMKLIEYLDWKGVKLSREGRETAERIIRAHRLFESLLVNVVGVSLEEACRSASLIDSQASEQLMDKICEFLGHPSTCPHGYSIPRSPSCCKAEEK